MESARKIKLHFEGVLEKAGKRFFEGFRKRWFILDGKDLTYYKASEYTDENYLGTIDLSRVKSVTQTKSISNGFQIVTRSRTYTFSAPTPELLADWLSVLRQAMQLKSFQTRKNSRTDSVESQYEEVDTRSQSSASAVSSRSDISVDESDNNFYESVVHTKKPLSASTDSEYELIPGNGPDDNEGDEADYDIVGGPPSNEDRAVGSVGAPLGVASSSDSVGVSSDSADGLVGPGVGPALTGLVAAVSGLEPEYGLVGTPSSPVSVDPDIAREVSGPQSDTVPPTYAIVQRKVSGSVGELSDVKASDNYLAEMSGGVPPNKDGVGGNNGYDDSSSQYAEVGLPESKCAEEKENKGDSTESPAKEASLARYGSLKHQQMLSRISEDCDEQVEQGGSEERNVEESPAPSPTGGITAHAITEMKKFLEQAAKQDDSSEKDEESSAENESPMIGSSSAFELLKQLLQRLDSQEAN